MNAWNESLDAAGIREPALRRDYDAQRRLVSRFRRTSYLAVQLLLPRPMLPHVVAATAVMHHGDNLLDTGTKTQRAARWASWEQQVRQVLDTGVSGDPLLRTLAHTIAAHPRLRRTVEEYLSTATAELEFSGFHDEADYQAYVDAYSLPAFMLVGALVGPENDDGSYRAACRTFMDGSQRLDFVNDIAEDLREGRLGIPAKTLELFSVKLEDVAAGREVPGVRELVAHEVGQARTTLQAAGELPALAPAPYRPLMGALIEVELLTADAALARGAKLLRGSARPSPVPALRVLLGARRRARKGG
ncbi:squalene/phytoene synthase family protein [Streptomyces gibsoniae]|uniref:Squalene/phytoene synthase family protein n=1 Tax=Streptomyces gibsoniae TaxID=3075529 RepID=A0ABU2TN18_9ACTN|nr:squalene/phytoene synthase family protein [Streptomyces sp. DSM 41699]MDT0462241.1 squalene/phytoene synthase family protein [Streptomyces sp. DSM 41699]